MRRIGARDARGSGTPFAMGRRRGGLGAARRRCAAEDGQAMLLGIGMIAVVIALVLGIASVTAVYLDVKRLTAMADSAAAAGAGRTAPDNYYAGGGGGAVEGAPMSTGDTGACGDCSSGAPAPPDGLPPAPAAMDDASVRSAAVGDLAAQADAGTASAGGLSGVSVSDARAEEGRVAVVTLSAHSRPPFLPWGLLPFEGFDISATGSARTTTAP